MNVKKQVQSLVLGVVVTFLLVTFAVQRLPRFLFYYGQWILPVITIYGIFVERDLVPCVNKIFEKINVIKIKLPIVIGIGVMAIYNYRYLLSTTLSKLQRENKFTGIFISLVVSLVVSQLYVVITKRDLTFFDFLKLAFYKKEIKKSKWKQKREDKKKRKEEEKQSKKDEKEKKKNDKNIKKIQEKQEKLQEKQSKKNDKGTLNWENFK